MVMATSRNGDQLIMIQTGDAPSPLTGYEHLPLSFACVVAQHEGKILFVFNPWRQEWELPAGGIEPNESAHMAAIRELYEESSQIAQNMRFWGMVLLYIKNQQAYELGALYGCELDELRPFIPNDEADKIMLWDMKSSVPEHINELGIKLAQMVISG
ncbi:MAG: NUDIX domain-containing protein [bacterium]|nr:NUDIX domain-containing protein [bacterium]